MNYWLLTSEYPPQHGGGISTYCAYTAEMLAGAGINVTVITQDDSVKDFIITQTKKNIRVITFNSNRNKLHNTLGYTARLSYAFAKIVQQLIEAGDKPDIIESQDYLGIAYYLTQFKHTGYEFLSGIPIIITLHSPAFIYLCYNRVPVSRFPDFHTGEMEKQAIVAADALISPTRFLVTEIEHHICLKNKQIEVVANPFSGSDNVPQQFERNRIIFYGKLSPQKGSFELLQYFRQLWDDGFQHPLHIIGGTDIVYHPEMKTMGQLVSGRYKKYIKGGLLQLHGKIKPAQIKSALQQAQVIIVPSIVDNMPYVVMEAMNLGKIVLASKRGGQHEMIEHGKSGFLFDHEIPGDFAEKLQTVLQLSDADVNCIGDSARKSVKENYSFGIVLKKKMAFINQLISAEKVSCVFPFLHQEPIQQISVSPVSKKDVLTVIIPFYNLGKYLNECVHSVLQSTYKNIELLIINDGSSDAESISILDKLSIENGRIIHTKNNGIAAARNLGAKEASGEFIAFLDADDKVKPTYYEKAIAVLKQKSNVFFVGSWVQYFENSNAVWPTFTPQPPYALVHNPINSSGLVYKKDAFITGGLNDRKTDYGLEDYESVIQMLHNGFNGVVLPEILFYYRVRSGSMFRNVSPQKLLYSNKYIAAKHAAYFKKFAIEIIDILNANGPGFMYDNPTMETTVLVKNTAENRLIFKLKSFVKKTAWLKSALLKIKRN